MGRGAYLQGPQGDIWHSILYQILTTQEQIPPCVPRLRSSVHPRYMLGAGLPPQLRILHPILPFEVLGSVYVVGPMEAVAVSVSFQKANFLVWHGQLEEDRAGALLKVQAQEELLEG